MGISRRKLLLGIPAAAAALAIPTAVERERHTHAFPRGVPTLPYPARKPQLVNVYSTAKLPLGIDPERFIAAMQRYVNEFLFPVWGVAANLQWAAGPVKGAFNLAFVDQSDVEGAIAYHSFDPDVMAAPYGEIAVLESYLDNPTSELGVPFSHELGEILVNPGLTNWSAASPDNEAPGLPFRILEIADPVERTYFRLDGFDMSNFVFPAYFEPWRDGQLDFLNLVKMPGEILPGGYQITRVGDEVTRTVNRGSYIDDGQLCWRVRKLLGTLHG